MVNIAPSKSHETHGYALPLSSTAPVAATHPALKRVKEGSRQPGPRVWQGCYNHASRRLFMLHRSIAKTLMQRWLKRHVTIMFSASTIKQQYCK